MPPSDTILFRIGFNMTLEIDIITLFDVIWIQGWS